ncbi:hypothetical protein GOODEAATRI_027176 [Goodea atripinnis]|uniref:CTCK domain-containing protein n=1 Tax=Goodea atripinnis TaxID=208336 RepID=A0ABV0PS12_9TELE
MPRKIQVPGECCEKWVCEPQAESSALGGFAMAGEGSRCQRVVRSDKAVHLSYKNCTSVLAYKPRYCGSCTDGRCCTPYRTKTNLVEFQCSNGKTSRKPVMAILTCVCHTHCPRDNTVWEPSQLPYRGMRQ